MAETDYNKYVFGAYLNMALDNFLNTVKLLAAKMKVDYEEGSPASIIKKNIRQRKYVPQCGEYRGILFSVDEGINERPWLRQGL